MKIGRRLEDKGNFKQMYGNRVISMLNYVVKTKY